MDHGREFKLKKNTLIYDAWHFCHTDEKAIYLDSVPKIPAWQFVKFVRFFFFWLLMKTGLTDKKTMNHHKKFNYCTHTPHQGPAFPVLVAMQMGLCSVATSFFLHGKNGARVNNDFWPVKWRKSCTKIDLKDMHQAMSV